MISTRPILHAAAEAIVPAARYLDREGWQTFDRVIERELGDRPAWVRRRFHLFLRVLDLLPIARHGVLFRALDARRRLEVLSSLHDSSSALLRQGVFALRTIVFMGYEGSPEDRDEPPDSEESERSRVRRAR